MVRIFLLYLLNGSGKLELEVERGKVLRNLELEHREENLGVGTWFLGTLFLFLGTISYVGTYQTIPSSYFPIS